MSIISALERARPESIDLQGSTAPLTLRVTALLATASERVDYLLKDLSPSPTRVSHWEFRNNGNGQSPQVVCIAGDPTRPPPLTFKDASEVFRQLNGKTRRSYPRR